MAHDSDGSDDAEDLDRAAILARRQRFIALALTGLAAACGDDVTGGPQPCLDVAPQTESSTVTGPSEGDASATSTTGSQQPCLGALPETSSTDTSGAADSTTSTGTDTGQTTGTTDTTDGTDTGGSSTGGPLPCLAPPR